MSPDLINGVFEGVGAILTSLNVLKLYKDKCIRGVHFAPVVFFTSWGAWNIFYYNHLNQPISWYAGIVLFIVNATWLIQMFIYRKN